MFSRAETTPSNGAVFRTKHFGLGFHPMTATGFSNKAGCETDHRAVLLEGNEWNSEAGFFLVAESLKRQSFLGCRNS